MRLVLEWTRIQRAELQANWERVQRHEPPLADRAAPVTHYLHVRAQHTALDRRQPTTRSTYASKTAQAPTSTFPTSLTTAASLLRSVTPRTSGSSAPIGKPARSSGRTTPTSPRKRCARTLSGAQPQPRKLLRWRQQRGAATSALVALATAISPRSAPWSRAAGARSRDDAPRARALRARRDHRPPQIPVVGWPRHSAMRCPHDGQVAWPTSA